MNDLDKIKELIAQYPDTLHEACNRIMEISFKAGQKIQGDIIVGLATKEYNAGFSSGSATTIAKIRERMLVTPDDDVMDMNGIDAWYAYQRLMEKNIQDVEGE